MNPSTVLHRMKLREPWQRASGGDRVEFRRAFNRPTNLDSQERVYVSIHAARATGAVRVNGTAIGEMSAGDDTAFDVTRLLEDHNQLVIAVAAIADTTALPFAETAIEIRSVP